jgi:hypothetical protein
MGLLKGMMGLEREMEERLSRLAWIGMATVFTMNMDAIEKRVAIPLKHMLQALSGKASRLTGRLWRVAEPVR